MVRFNSTKPFKDAPIVEVPFRGAAKNITKESDDKLRKIIETSNFGKNAPIPELKVKEEPKKVKTPPTLASQISKINQQIHMENKDLPSEIERKRSHFARRLEAWVESVQATVFSASRTINDVTGYTSIEKLKFSIDQLEEDLKNSRSEVKKRKAQYTEMIQERSNLQREVNDLLTRKHNWSPEDLERFTQLYRNDHANEQRETETEHSLAEQELRVDSIQIKLTQMILTRYHEEQIWSDKIRRASTWGTWVLMGLNIALFIVATFLVEPWKRKRLVGSFEAKVKELLANGGELTRETLDDLEAVITETPVEAELETLKPSPKLEPYKLSFSGRFLEIGQLVKTNFNRLISKDTQTIQVDKLELGIITSVVTVFGCVAGSLVTLYFSR